ncbi:DUF4326 domain-containing protein [Coraliomargarita sp. SDUM461004]|uniref:DUF4326 domain-containing protein n=1 Tax=Thalassobacterium sedimentorum TaxID=3041258 RepID=A0ABU1AG81_9BACT|nr:DUF4326 domain-containing protein [Coraliomargarita sp. SDUM461004]MDQ8193827.1 DUF4326 domain-containing protein [Coraliomargarita sp. SDUM461004]
MTTDHLPISIPDILHGKTVKRELLKNGPQRVQRKRTKGWKMPPNTVSVCRPGRWGNPFSVGKPATHVPSAFQGYIARDVSEAVEFYRSMLLQYGLPSGCELSELRGKNLACWCKIGTSCHADLLLELANKL